nr:MAG TPA: hypothetical protein [Bacteriophage sp.]
MEMKNKKSKSNSCEIWLRFSVILSNILNIFQKISLKFSGQHFWYAPIPETQNIKTDLRFCQNLVLIWCCF